MSSRPPRFTRQVSRQIAPADSAAGAGVAELASELEQFSERRQADLDQRARESGFEAGQVAGTAGEGTTGNANTLRGDAFNRGVLVAHQASLQTDIRDSIGKFHLEHPNDPDTFDARVEGLQEGLMEEALPQMRPFIQQRIADYAGRTKLAIIEQQQRELLAQAGEDLERGVEGFMDDARTASFEGNVPLVEARRQELQSILGTALEGGLLDERQVLDASEEFESNVTSQEVIGEFDRLIRNTGVEAAEPAIARWQDVKPSEVGLSSDEHLAVTRQMVTLRNRQRSLMADQIATRNAEQLAVRNAKVDSVKSAISVLRDGFTPDQQSAERVAKDLIELDDPELAADYDVAQAIQGEVHRFRRTPAFVRQKELTELERSLRRGGAREDQLDLLAALQKTNTEVNQQIVNDPRGFVNREGLIDDPPLDVSSAEAMVESLAGRREASAIGAELIGEPLPLLSAAEADQLAEVYQGSEIEERVGLLGVITAGAQDDSLATLAQLDAKGHSRMALLGSFVLAGSGQLARDVMRGQAVLMGDTGIKPKRADYQGTVDDEVGAALADVPAQRQQYIEAAFAKYAELKVREGDLSDVYDSDLFETALNQVLPTARFNGRRVAIPQGTTEDNFEDWTEGWQPSQFEDVAGGTGEEILDLVRDIGRLTELGYGRYGILMNSALSGADTVLVDENGEPFILEFGTNPTP